ncbi:MAG TPA: hypothetical protein VID67_10575 [Rhizomicrobium sp.]
MALAFLTVMSLTGIVDSFLPRRAARRYAAMYDMMPAIRSEAAPLASFAVVPPAEEAPAEAPPVALEPEVAEPGSEDPDSSGDLRHAESVNTQAYRRSLPPPSKVLRPQKP